MPSDSDFCSWVLSIAVMETNSFRVVDAGHQPELQRGHQRHDRQQDIGQGGGEAEAIELESAQEDMQRHDIGGIAGPPSVMM